jgi:hypothetical protein
MKNPRDPLNIMKEIFDKIDEKDGKALKYHLKMEVFGGSEQQFHRWIVKFCINSHHLIRKGGEGKGATYVKTEKGELHHRLFKEYLMPGLKRIIRSLSGKRLRIF